MAGKDIVLSGIAALIFVLILVLIVPAFLLPEPVYKAVYGWRYPKTWSAGDAEIVDLGPAAASDRFRIHIELPLQSGEYRKEIFLSNLPREEFTAGLLIPLEAPRSLWQKESTALKETVLEIVVANEQGSVSVGNRGTMRGDWTWSGPYGDSAFVYSLNTQFQADPQESYKLSVFISSGEKFPTGTAVWLQAGGWY